MYCMNSVDFVITTFDKKKWKHVYFNENLARENQTWNEPYFIPTSCLLSWYSFLEETPVVAHIKLVLCS